MWKDEADIRPDPDLPHRFADEMGRLLGPDFPTDVGVAVSGGSDSMALLLLAHGWARRMGVRLWVVTVDHGLRPDAAAEAAFVKAECEALGLSHTTLRWRDWDGRGNLQARARAARYDLIARWSGVIDHVLVGHTQDDLAETFLMRLARGSGVDGLSAMAARVPYAFSRPSKGRAILSEDRDGPLPDQTRPMADPCPGFDILRPLRAETRAALRAYLRFHKTDWVEDPSNQNLRFDRVKARKALEALSELGLDPGRLADTAHRMARARDALRARAMDASALCVTSAPWGDVIFDRARLAELDPETGLRLMAEALRVVSSDPYRPRASALEDALDRAVSGGRMTLHGCLVTADADRLIVSRELAAVVSHRVQFNNAPWDKRWWALKRPEFAGFELAALGEAGAAQLTARPADIPYVSLLAMPAVFDGDRLVAFAPAGHGTAYSCKLNPPGGAFAAGWAPLKRGG